MALGGISGALVERPPASITTIRSAGLIGAVTGTVREGVNAVDQEFSEMYSIEVINDGDHAGLLVLTDTLVADGGEIAYDALPEDAIIIPFPGGSDTINSAAIRSFRSNLSRAAAYFVAVEGLSTAEIKAIAIIYRDPVLTADRSVTTVEVADA